MLASRAVPGPFLDFLVKSGSRIPGSTGRCVILEFGTRAPFVGFLVKSGTMDTTGTGKCISLEFGTSARFIGFW